ncbi:MAG: hypothetical protein ACLGIZ_00940 [Acidimicrobiia bacterium]
MLVGAGTMHFVSPEFFDDLVPSWVPGEPRFWTNISGVAEIAVGALVANRRTERIGGWAALAVFVAVYPANVDDAISNPPTDARGVASLVRLPLQLPLFAWALHHGRARHSGRVPAARDDTSH